VACPLLSLAEPTKKLNEAKESSFSHAHKRPSSLASQKGVFATLLQVENSRHSTSACTVCRCTKLLL